MEAEPAALVGSGAATLAGLMISDSWIQVKGRLARFFAHDGTVQGMIQELVISRGELLVAHETGDNITAADIEAEWRARLRRLLQSDPAGGEELLHLLESLRSRPRAQRPGTLRNIVSGGVQLGPVVQSGQISGPALHALPAPAWDEYVAENKNEG